MSFSNTMKLEYFVFFILDFEYGVVACSYLEKIILMASEDFFMQTKICPTSSLHDEDLTKEQIEWSNDFNLPDNKFLQDLEKHSTDSEKGDFREWRLVEHVKSTSLFGLLQIFDGKVYFNSEKRQLVLVCISHFTSQGKTSYNFCTSTAVRFGEKIRLLVNKFKVRPLVLVTGKDEGGHLAQLITYTMNNLCIDQGRLNILEKKEEGVGAYTGVFDAVPAFRMIEKLAKEPLDLDALRLAITNYISDPKLIDCCATEGPHVGKVVFLEKAETFQVNQEQGQLLQKKEQVLTNVGSLNLNCANFNLEDLQGVQSFEQVQKEEQNNFIPWFVFDKSESELLTSEDSKNDSEKNSEIPRFTYIENLKYVMPSDVPAAEFVARVKFHKIKLNLLYVPINLSAQVAVESTSGESSELGAVCAPVM
jgi:hypothetical protein